MICKRQKLFSCFLRLYLISFFIAYCTIHSFLYETNLYTVALIYTGSHRAIILVKCVQFILFFHIMVIFPFIGKLKKVKWGVFALHIAAFISYTPRKRRVAHNFTKMRLQHRCFPMEFSKFLRTPFWENTSRQLLLKNPYCSVF